MNQTFISTFDVARYNENVWEDNLREMRDIYARFVQLGVPTVPSSRIGSYHGAFESLMKIAVEDHSLDQSLAELMLHAMVEFSQLKTILKAATSSSLHALWDERLRSLVAGTVMPSDGPKQSSARDFQFESFVAAVAELSGYQIRFDEPDVIVQNDTCTFGVAAKRPRSSRTIAKNCRKAARQTQQSGIPGIVALDVSFALYPNKCVNTNALAGALTCVEASVNRFVIEQYNVLYNICAGDNVLGVLVSLHMPVLNFGHVGGPQLATAIRWTVVPFCTPSDERLGWVLQFAQACELGLFGPRPQSTT